MNSRFHSFIVEITGATALSAPEPMQSLWSGYGAITRYHLEGCQHPSVVVKQVSPPTVNTHPRGWNSSLSHQRKMRSYAVESHWYRDYSVQCDASCRVAACLGLTAADGEFCMVLEDLDASGFSLRKSSVSLQDMHNCLGWLANFHATFMEQIPEGLWPVGTYWHLDTRPDELAALDDVPLQQAAGKIDQLLRMARYQTFVHGDAKLANFCFSASDDGVAAVDFQYVGGGCGMKDVAYFIGSCLREDDCERYVPELLDAYFVRLSAALRVRRSAIAADAVEEEWRRLFPVAWADFHRFIKGWSPGHWKINDYSERLTRTLISELLQGP